VTDAAQGVQRRDRAAIAGRWTGEAVRATMHVHSVTAK
jgi:hypothetical protein